MQVIARATFAVLGVYVFVTLCESLAQTIRYRLFSPHSPGHLIAFFAVTGLILFLIIWLARHLVFCSEQWARRVAPPQDNRDRPADNFFIAAVFRLVLVFAGLLLFYKAFPTLLRIAVFIIFIPRQIVNAVIFRQVPNQLTPFGFQIPGIIYNLTITALALWLISGAPNLVRRHFSPAGSVDSEAKNE